MILEWASARLWFFVTTYGALMILVGVFKMQAMGAEAEVADCLRNATEAELAVAERVAAAEQEARALLSERIKEIETAALERKAVTDEIISEARRKQKEAEQEAARLKRNQPESIECTDWQQQPFPCSP